MVCYFFVLIILCSPIVRAKFYYKTNNINNCINTCSNSYTDTNSCNNKNHINIYNDNCANNNNYCLV